MKALHGRSCALGLALGLIAGIAQADPVQFNFQIHFSGGPVTTALGTIAVDGADCPGGICDGSFTPDDAAHTLLDVTIVVDGNTFDMEDDFGFGFGWPIFGLVNNGITAIDYSVLGTAGVSPSFALYPTGGGYYATADGAVSQVVGIQQVPEPATMLLTAGALVGWLSAKRRRRLH